MSDLSPRTPVFPAPPADTAGAFLIGPGTTGMAMAEALGGPGLEDSRTEGDTVRRRRRRRLGFIFWLAVTWLVVVIGLAVVAGQLHIPGPNRTGVGGLGEGPGMHHLLGTDQLGRDIFSRVIFGSRVTLIVGFFSIAFAMVVGGGIGLIAGYYRGRIESVLMSVVDVLLAFPALVFALAVITFLGRSTIDVTMTLGVLSIAPLARVVRSSTIVFSQREFVLAARTLGASGRRILFREVLPNVVPAGLSFALIGVALPMVAEGGLSFLGLSVNPQNPTWGGLIAQGNAVIEQHPLVSVVPAVVLFLTVLALNVAGDALRAVFDVKEAAV